MMTHFPFSAQGLFFLSGACISGSFFSFSSTYSLMAAMLFDNGQRSIEAWYFMFSICFLSASLSMAARILGSIAQDLYFRRADTTKNKLPLIKRFRTSTKNPNKLFRTIKTQYTDAQI